MHVHLGFGEIWPKHLVHVIKLNTAKVLCLVEIYNYLLIIIKPDEFHQNS